MTDLETRLKHQEDLEAIRCLKHYHYCLCIDRAVAGEPGAIEQTISRFAEDIVADFSGFPLFEGKDQVSTFFSQAVPSFLSYSQHRVMNEVIDIDGDTATATWYLDCPADFRPGNPTGLEGSGVIAGRYQEEYVRQDGVWKWQRITALLDVLQPFETHWRGAKFLSANR